MEKLFKTETRKVRVREDVFVRETFGHWYDCDENEYIKDESVYRKEYVEVSKSMTLFYCPICNGWQEESDYLRTAIKSERTLWIANMVTHYRHGHITSWNKCFGKNGHYYQKNWFHEYSEEKAKINERAKRQIIRKCRPFLIENGFTVNDFEKLKGNSTETISLAEKSLFSS